VVRAADGLAGWQVTLRERLPVWTNSQLLAATVVQVLVDEQGGVMSATVKPPGSGLAAADQEALRLARALRFERVQPLEGATKPVWGDVEFVWLTVAPPDTPQTSTSP
jgi:TonB family protein